MKHCLNKRDHYHATPTDDETDLPEKLQTRNTRKHPQPEISTHEGRRSLVELTYAKVYDKRRGITYFTPLVFK